MSEGGRELKGVARQVLEAVLARLVPEDGYPSAVQAGAMCYVDRYLAGGAGPAWSLVEGGLAALDGEARARHGESFVFLAAQDQDAVLRGLEAGEALGRWDVPPAEFLAAVVEIAADSYYADPGNGGNQGAVSWQMLGYPVPVEPRAPGRLPAVTGSVDAVGDAYDVVVVGAGAGGGVAAYVLALSGARVLVVERGDALTAAQVPGDHLRNHRLSLFGHNTGPAVVGNPRVMALGGRDEIVAPHQDAWNNNAMTLGGGTRVWGAQAWRMSPADFRLASTYGVPDASSLADWPVSYEDIEPYYDKVEWAMGVAGSEGHDHMGPRRRPYPMAPLAPGLAAQRLAEGAARLGWQTGPVPLMVNAVPYNGRDACVRCSQCIGFACPVDAKTGSHNSVLADATATGRCTVLTGTRAVEILHSKSLRPRPAGQGAPRATGVRLVAESSPERAREVRAGAVVVAAGAIETARLLLLSGLGGPVVGRNLQGHTYVGAVGLFDDPVVEGRGPGPSIATCRFLHSNPGVMAGGMLADEFVKTPATYWHTCLPPGAPRWGAAGKAAMRDGYRRTAHVMGPVQEIPSGSSRVTLDARVKDALGLPVARLSGHGHPDDRLAAELLARRASEWMEASGARTVWTWPRPRAETRLSAGQHQAGTCRMGTAPATSVCDPQAVLHDCANVVLADGSVHVTNGGVNPALTIMALAWRSSEALASRL